MNTRTSAAPASARSSAARCASVPVPASTRAGSRPGSSQVLLPVGPVHSDGFPAGTRIGVILLEKVLHSNIAEIAFGKAADGVWPAAAEESERSLEREVVLQIRG